MTKNLKVQQKFEWLHRRSLVWVVLAVIVLMMSWWLPVSVVESFYYRGIFRLIRVTYDFILGWIPVPMIYLVVLIVIARILMWSREMKKGIAYQLTRLVGGVAFIVAAFYIVWAFNYKQIQLQDRLGIVLEDVTLADLEREFLVATQELQKEAEGLAEDYTSDEAISSLKVTDKDLRDEVEKALADLDLPNSGNVRVRQLWPKGFLLRWSTAGIYIPHAFEGHIDQGMLSVQKPFTMAHEMAHGYGVTDEGACNFIAWLACRQSNNKWIRFSGAFTYWRYAAAEMPNDSVKKVIDSLPPVVSRALYLVRENDKKYPDIMPQIRDAIYSTYLKRHGVKGGLRSYNYVVMMVSRYRAQNNIK